MQRISVPVDRAAMATTTFDVSSFPKGDFKSEADYDLTANNIEKLTVEINGETKNNIDHPETVQFDGKTISVRFASWPLKVGTSQVVTMRVFEADATIPKNTICGPFMYTQIVVVAF